MSHHHDINCDSGPPYSFAFYAYKSKLYFLRNAMLMIFCSLVKIITTHTHTHTHTHVYEYIKKQPKNKFFYSVNLLQLWLHIVSHTSRRQPQIYRVVHVSSYTYILDITYASTHNNTQI